MTMTKTNNIPDVDYVGLALQLIAAFPADLAAVEGLISSVSSTWSETDKQKVSDALEAAKTQDDADTEQLDAED